MSDSLLSMPFLSAQRKQEIKNPPKPDGFHQITCQD